MSGMETGVEVMIVWCLEKGSVEGGRAMDFWALSRAVVLLMVRRCWGIRSASSEEGRESTSESGIPSSSSLSSSCISESRGAA